MSNNHLPQEPLKKIALSCSGGGYRAASYHLGTMAYLNSIEFQGKPLLENVQLISTVSGGTITGAVYALQKQQGKSFKEIYSFLMDKIGHLDLVKLGIMQLNPDAVWNNTKKRKNLINAFAEIYEKEFTAGATMGDFNTMHSHLQVVVFNSTEFNNGINFRFRNKGSGFFGNQRIRVSQDIADEVKVSDAIASSSSFPGGFEPLMWPADYRHTQSPHLDKLSDDMQGVGIMDGGIYDNQGIESILIYKQKPDEAYFDLVIISDVASPYMNPFKASEDGAKKGFLKLNLKEAGSKGVKISKIINIVLLALATIAGLLPFFWDYTPGWGTSISLAFSLAFIMLFLFKWWLVSKLISVIGNQFTILLNKLPVFYREKFTFLRVEEISFHRILPLLFDRINSVITLLSDVFLKVVRRLNYYKLYNDDKYKFRRITSLIKELTKTDFELKNNTNSSSNILASGFPPNPVTGNYADVVSQLMSDVVEEASSFGTTLWFTEDEQLSDMLSKLVAAGEFTMCYNMVDYLFNFIYTPGNGYEALPQNTRAMLEALYTRCLNDWNHFKTDPMWLVKATQTNP